MLGIKIDSILNSAKDRIFPESFTKISSRGFIGPKVTEFFFIIFTLLFFVGIAKKWLFFRLPSETMLAGVPTLNSPQSKSNRMNILFLGIDSVEGTHRTDTMVLVGVDPIEQKINALSIPRDTRVILNGSSRKINEVLPRFGETVLQAMLEELLEIRIDRMVSVDFAGFIKLIDIIDGVDLHIDHPMNYDDNWGNVHIHFNVGPAHLDGKKSLEYVRFRADANADLGRIKRQQQFITAVIEKMRSPSIFVRLPQIIQEGLKNLQTDLSISEVLEMFYALKLGELKVQTISLPGEPKYIDKISYYLPYKDQAVAIGAKSFANILSLELDASFSRKLEPASNTRQP